MDVYVTRREGDKEYNRSGEQVILCETGCGRKTTMLGTRLCDHCWEDSRRKRDSGDEE